MLCVLVTFNLVLWWPSDHQQSGPGGCDLQEAGERSRILSDSCGRGERERGRKREITLIKYLCVCVCVCARMRKTVLSRGSDRTSVHLGERVKEE